MRRDQSSWISTKRLSALHERQTSCVPPEVLETVPSCAISCLENFIQTEYSTSCANTSSLQFLCVTPNPSGFALGEAALSCVISNCSSTSSEVSVYNICAGIMNAIPETMSTITATVAPSVATTPARLPTPPTTAPPVSQITSATLTTPGSSAVPSVTSSTPSSTVPANLETATATAAVAAKVQNAALSTGTIAGIAVAGVAAAVAVLALLFFIFCLRRKKNKRRVSQRWSIGLFPPSPPEKDPEQFSKVPAPTYLPNQRYYASTPGGEQRRSFWRKSINPVDIGVAVSPGRVEQASPGSISSERSASRLLTNSQETSMWPAPLMKSPTPPPKDAPNQAGNAVAALDKSDRGPSSSHPKFSVYAPYETRLPGMQRPSQVSYSRPMNSVPRVSIQAPYETRLTRLPPQMPPSRAGLPPNTQTNRAYNAERARGAAMTGRIPLTPIYDNGNFSDTPYSRAAPVAYQWDTPESMNQLSRPVPEASVRAPMGLNISNVAARVPQLGKDSLHKSIASDSTTFEEETTTEEEIDRQFKAAQSESVDQYLNGRLEPVQEGDASPIKNLAYPQIPRPAAVSRQAQQVPRPRAGQTMRTAEADPPRVTQGLSRRYELIRAGGSYLISETTSSSSSSTSAPSLLAQRRVGQKKDLRIQTPNAAANALNSRWKVSTEPVAPPPVARKALPVKTSQSQPTLKEISPRAKVTPKTNSRGDLFLMVED